MSGTKMLATRIESIKKAYFDLFAQMDLNSRDLEDLCEDVREQREQFHRNEQTYKQAYEEMRAELVNELKKSKTLFENYYSLGQKYKSLKKVLDQTISHEAELATSRERLYQEEDLKNFEIQTLKQRLSDLELKYTNLQIEKDMQRDNYESEIHDLLLQLSLRNNERKDTSAGSNIFSTGQYDRTPFHNGNNSYDSNSHSWDTDYLKNIDGFIER
ncbi:CRB_1a_G0023170.mRNA.1.CDS.1 [Saccharomyces cerevisiae]|nr:CRB_1a_G0023170.mRNA.1.CDS.1 [Saccharomyces cerevisiae]CAI7325096.1 CRB_1a_G0023170.mRNA.1.CDS.1 [Saccharomyces cerevisiae]